MKKKNQVVQEVQSTIEPIEQTLEKVVSYKQYWRYAWISLLALSVIVIGIRGYQKMQEKNCQNAYIKADTEEKKKAFVHEFLGKPLAAKVSLELADKLYTEANYEEALKFYEMAYRGLVRTPLRGRAQLGKAMSLMHTQKIEQAEKILKSLIKSQQALGALQAEAALQALLLAIQGKDQEAIQKYKEELEGLPYSDSAKERLDLIEEMGAEQSKGPLEETPKEP